LSVKIKCICFCCKTGQKSSLKLAPLPISKLF
jgi:hypothetical protein